MATLTANQKAAFRTISSEAINLVKENLIGSEYIRIFLYEDAMNELLTKGETDLEICGAHHFSSSQWNDIDQQNQIEVGSFEQSNDIDEDWLDCQRGEYWISEIEKEIDAEILTAIKNA